MPSLEKLTAKKADLDRQIAAASLEPLRAARESATKLAAESDLEQARLAVSSISAEAAMALANAALALRNARTTLDRLVQAAEHAAADPSASEEAAADD